QNTCHADTVCPLARAIKRTDMGLEMQGHRSMTPIRWQPDRSTPKPPWPVPSLGLGMARGLAGRCPACGEGRIFNGFLRVAAECDHCHAPLGLARADDAPPYFTILVVGHIVIPLMLIMEKMSSPPTWVLSAIFVP